MSSSEHCRRSIFKIYNVQNLKITRITTFRIRNVVYQAGSRWDPKCVFNFLRFFERTLCKSNYTIFILSWCGTDTKIRSKLVDIVTAEWQKITLWGPQRTPLGILRVKSYSPLSASVSSAVEISWAIITGGYNPQMAETSTAKPLQHPDPLFWILTQTLDGESKHWRAAPPISSETRVPWYCLLQMFPVVTRTPGTAHQTKKPLLPRFLSIIPGFQRAKCNRDPAVVRIARRTMYV